MSVTLLRRDALRHPLRAQRRPSSALFVVGGAARHPERCALRVRRRPAADLRARRLRAEHDHPRSTPRRRPGDRRVRHRSARRRRLRRHQPAAAAGDHRDRRRRVRAPLRPQHLAHGRRRLSSTSSSGGAAQGASTLTQQLARNLQDQFGLDASEKLVRAEDQGDRPRDSDREALHEEGDLHALLQPDVPRARRLRRRSASRLYFDKSNKQLDARGSGADRRHLPDARAAEPVRGHEARDVAGATIVLQRMADERYITAGAGRRSQAEADRHARPAQPAARHRAVLRRRSPQASRAPSTARRRSTKTACSVTTTLDARLQELANTRDRARAARASTSGTATASRRANILAEGTHDRGVQGRSLDPADRRRRHRARRRRHGAARPAPARAAHRRAITPSSTPRRLSRGRAARRRPDLFKPGDLIEVADRQDRSTRSDAATVTLEQTPLVEGALLAIDNRTGQIRAMVGGWSFSRSKFNRAMQAYRQLGSTFKPIVYTAAIDRGFTPASIIVDAPVELHRSGNGQTVQPAQLRSQVRRARHAAPRARGIAQHPGGQDDGRRSARRTCSTYAKRFGFEEDFPPYLPIALGARRCDAARDHQRLLGVPESGRADEAVLRAEREGSRRQPARREPCRAERRHPRRHGVRDDQPAARRRSPRGTGARPPAWRPTGRWPARPARWTRTPTRGSSASIPTSRSASGSATTRRSRSAATEQGAFAALPIWMEFMKRYIDGRPDKDDPPDFEAPGNIVFLPVDKTNGATAWPADRPARSTRRSSPARSPADSNHAP